MLSTAAIIRSQPTTHHTLFAQQNTIVFYCSYPSVRPASLDSRTTSLGSSTVT
jgi:hypothetical protein